MCFALDLRAIKYPFLHTTPTVLLCCEIFQLNKTFEILLTFARQENSDPINTQGKGNREELQKKNRSRSSCIAVSYVTRHYGSAIATFIKLYVKIYQPSSLLQSLGRFIRDRNSARGT